MGKKNNFIACILTIILAFLCVSCNDASLSSYEIEKGDYNLIVSFSDEYTIDIVEDKKGNDGENEKENGEDNKEDKVKNKEENKEEKKTIYTISDAKDKNSISMFIYNNSEFDTLKSELYGLTESGDISDASFVIDDYGNSILDYIETNGNAKSYHEIRYLKGTYIYILLDAESEEEMEIFESIDISPKETDDSIDFVSSINELANYMQNYAGTMANTKEGLDALNSSNADSSLDSDAVDDDKSYIFDESLVSEEAVRLVAKEYGLSLIDEQIEKEYKTIIFSKAGTSTEIRLIIVADKADTSNYYKEELKSTGYDKVPNPVVLRVMDENSNTSYYAAMHDDDAIVIITTNDADECSDISARFGLIYNAEGDSYDEITYGTEPAIPQGGTMDLSMDNYRQIASYFGIIDDISETVDGGGIVGGDFMDGTTMSHATVDPIYVQATYEEILKSYGIQGPNPCVFDLNSRFIVIAYDTAGNIVMVSSASGNRLAQICKYFGISVTKQDQ